MPISKAVQWLAGGGKNNPHLISEFRLSLLEKDLKWKPLWKCLLTKEKKLNLSHRLDLPEFNLSFWNIGNMITSAFLSQRNVFCLNKMSASDLKTVIYLSQIYVCVTLQDSPVVMKSSIETTSTQLPSPALHTQCLTNCHFRETLTSSCKTQGNLGAAGLAGASFWRSGQRCVDVTELVLFVEVIKYPCLWKWCPQF